MPRDYVLQPFRSPIEPRIDYAAELNEQQFAAVTAPPGPALVIAGAGSGKTRALTYRTAFLLEQGIPPERILLLTFTNKAAKEMMRRVFDLLGGELSGLWGGTFHSIGARVLRRNATLLGYQADFSIMDREDARDMLKACLAEMEIDHEATRFPKADVLGDIFSLATNRDEPVETVIKTQFDYFAGIIPEIANARERYAERKNAANTMDFDDLLVLWLKLLRDNESIREEQQRRFQFILVDEYQDTNRIQGELIDLLAARHHNVMVVGDDSQSIYSWRGAHFQNIIKFPERYEKAAVYRIEINYRSTPEILNVANAAIAANVNQFAKHLTPARRSGPKPVLMPCMTGSEQASFVAQRILELREEGRELNKMAVLYRSHFHALELQLELSRRNIPYSITSGIRFFEQAHIKDVVAYVKFINNPRDELALKRIVRLLEGVGGKTADKIWNAFKASPGPPLAVALQKLSPVIPKKTSVAWAQFTATISQLEAEDIRRKPAVAMQLVLEAGYKEHLQEKYSNYTSRLEDVQQLAGYSRQFESVEEFLTQLALQTSIDAEENQAGQRDEEEIRLSTIHQAKGLEFDVVFIIMLCDGLFPSARSLENLENEEEERRLFYVAITRARDELHLSYPMIRTMGAGGEAMQRPSRFLGELPKELLDEWNLRVGY
ncbi:MAG TPA: UvrD-helicase domain-containing protein [Verrucomicrobiae bacterium]|jgi:DNA helicase-2/ATP-dependent DNA helicase PcrA|nr:UvrD-helicase domain-containing protein [Verrucomicrobiae bacterium]